MIGRVGFRRIAKMSAVRDLSRGIARDLSLVFFVDSLGFEAGDVLFDLRHVVGVNPGGQLHETGLAHARALLVLPERVLALGLIERRVAVSHDLLLACMRRCSCSAVESAFSTSHTSCALCRVQNRAVAAPSCLSDHAPWLSLPMVQVDVLLSMACFFQCAVSAGGFGLREFACRFVPFVYRRGFARWCGVLVERDLFVDVDLCGRFALRYDLLEQAHQVLRSAALVQCCGHVDSKFKAQWDVECERGFVRADGHFGVLLVVAMVVYVLFCFFVGFEKAVKFSIDEQCDSASKRCDSVSRHLLFPYLWFKFLWCFTTNTFSHKYLDVYTAEYLCST
jgi:hypothetical protein